MDARSTGVVESGIETLTAASAFVENGQNACARLDRSVAVHTMAVHITMRNC